MLYLIGAQKQIADKVSWQLLWRKSELLLGISEAILQETLATAGKT